jgi:DNA-binding CsgD family transcriptional regulator
MLPQAGDRSEPGATDEDREARALAALVDRYADLHGLSKRERAVLLLGARGLHRKGMATELGCSPGTVNTYWNRILRKLTLSSQAEVLARLISLALRSGWSREEARDGAACIEDQDKTPAVRRTNQVGS